MFLHVDKYVMSKQVYSCATPCVLRNIVINVISTKRVYTVRGRYIMVYTRDVFVDKLVLPGGFILAVLFDLVEVRLDRRY